MVPHEPAWPAAVVPLQIGVLQFPIPTARRCYKLGQALRLAIESYPGDLRVAIVATGGLSHQVHGERAGFNNPEWDAEFMDLLESRSGTAGRDDARRVRDARRHGGLRGDHVAGDARGDGATHSEAAPDLLSPVDDRHRHRDLRGRRHRGRSRGRRAHARQRGAPARRRREAAGHVSVRFRPQRQGVPSQRFPPPPGRAGASEGVPRRDPKRCSRRSASPARNAISSGDATGAG